MIHPNPHEAIFLMIRYLSLSDFLAIKELYVGDRSFWNRWDLDFDSDVLIEIIDACMIDRKDGVDLRESFAVIFDDYMQNCQFSTSEILSKFFYQYINWNFSQEVTASFEMGEESEFVIPFKRKNDDMAKIFLDTLKKYRDDCDDSFYGIEMGYASGRDRLSSFYTNLSKIFVLSSMYMQKYLLDYSSNFKKLYLDQRLFDHDYYAIREKYKDFDGKVYDQSELYLYHKSIEDSKVLKKVLESEVGIGEEKKKKRM